jgi:hypothetical protein
MSLWYKNPELVTYEDIAAFCTQQIPEGIRLDYKLDIPGDLGKVVAAFANTLGGLIILGIEGDKTTNTPIWPSAKGMKKSPGIEERITAICRDSIYPPVRPQISQVIDNPHLAETVLVVLRIDESPDAPHAVKGLIYERTGSQGTPYQLCHIDRISQLLARRGRIEEKRLDMMTNELKRATRQLAEMRRVLGANAGLNPTSIESKYPRGLPLRWASVIPLYPWRDLCEPMLCHQSMSLFQTDTSLTSWQKVPGGAYAKKKIAVGTTSGAEGACCSLSTKGHVFAAECAAEMLIRQELARQQSQRSGSGLSVDIQSTYRFASQLFDVAARFYQLSKVERPGYLSVSIGLIDVLGARMLSQPTSVDIISGQAFLDDDFAADLIVPLDQFLASPDQACAPLFNDLKFGFDL